MTAHLKPIRLQMNLTQRQVAACLHVSRQCYGLYERGEREPPLEFLTAFCDLAQISFDDLLDRPPGRPAAEQELLQAFRDLDEAGQRYVIRQAEYERAFLQLRNEKMPHSSSV